MDEAGPEVAEMVAVPNAIDVARPVAASMATQSGLLLAHVVCAKGMACPRASRTSAVN